MFDALVTDPPTEASAPAQLRASTRTPSPHDLSLRARSLAARIAALQAELVDVVTDAVTHETTLGEPVAGWLCRECRLLPDEAHRLTTLARRLPRLPATRAAFATGQLSEATATRIARVATPTNETDILAVAESATGAQLQTLLRSYQRVRPKAPPSQPGDDTPTGDDTHEPEPPVERTDTVRTHTDDHGRWHLHAELPLPWGTQIDAALRAIRDDEDFHPPTPADLHAHPDGHRSDERAHLTQAEALLRLAQHYLPERFHVLVTADADRLAAVTRHPTGVDLDDGCTFPGNGPLHPTVLDELACEAWLTAVLTRNGHPVTTTTPTRLATPAQQRALQVRDRTCRFPGCGRTTYLKAHHLVHAAHGGPTRLDNLVLLCQVHHTLIHKPGWHLTRHPDDTQVTPGQRPPPGPDPSPPAVAPRTPAPGERLTAFAHDVILHHWLSRCR
ncbi:MAG: HNH endonuclease [Acidimicrobiales bacterium]|nr:HNH endonuclease [Acidimicrobiales bacterium]